MSPSDQNEQQHQQQQYLPTSSLPSASAMGSSPPAVAPTTLSQPHLRKLHQLLTTANTAPETITAFLSQPSLLPYDSLGPFLYRDRAKPYTRNLILGTGSFAIMALVWSPRGRSPVHDHAGSLCWAKVVRGAMVERLYEAEGGRLRSTRRLAEGNVTFVTDQMGVHDMENQTDDWAVSVHVYAPPFSMCHTFGQNNNVREVKMVYDTVGGIKV